MMKNISLREALSILKNNRHCASVENNDSLTGLKFCQQLLTQAFSELQSVGLLFIFFFNGSVHIKPCVQSATFIFRLRVIYFRNSALFVHFG